MSDHGAVTRPHFSRRLPEALALNPLTQRLQARRAAGLPILDLTESNPTQASLAYPTDAVRAALASPAALTYTPDPAGLLSAREAVSAYYTERGYDVAPDRILLTASTSEAYAYLFKLLMEPGDEVLVPRPSYPLFEFLARLEHVRVVQYPLHYHGNWILDRDALHQALSPRTRAVLLVNPNNPTGSYLRRDDRAFLKVLCAERGLALVSDEVFADYPLINDAERVPTLVDEDQCLTFCLSGLSKVAGLPQLKLGWVVVAGPADLRDEALAHLEFIADTYLSVGTPVQQALPTLLRVGGIVRQQIRDRTQENLRLLREHLGAAPATRLLQAEGGWHATLQVTRTRSEEEWVLHLLDEHGVLVQPGYFYDFDREAFLVLSLLTPSEAFAEGVRRVLAAVG